MAGDSTAHILMLTDGVPVGLNLCPYLCKTISVEFGLFRVIMYKFNAKALLQALAEYLCFCTFVFLSLVLVLPAATDGAVP